MPSIGTWDNTVTSISKSTYWSWKKSTAASLAVTSSSYKNLLPFHKVLKIAIKNRDEDWKENKRIWTRQ